jgi:hypothetical protein
MKRRTAKNAALQHKTDIMVNTVYVNRNCALHQSLCPMRGPAGHGDYLVRSVEARDVALAVNQYSLCEHWKS